MDTWPDRQAQVMARWELAGSIGAVAGPLLLTAVLASGGGWRDAYLVLAVLAALAWLGRWRREPQAAGTGGVTGTGGEGEGDREGEEDGEGEGEGDGEGRAWRWLVLLQVTDLLGDVFTGFLALYLVDVEHLRPTVAALAIAIRLGASLGGGGALVVVLERVGDLAVLRATAVAAALLYPAFLLVPGVAPKLAILAVLSAATAPWYPLLQARLYGSLPGRSSVAVTLSSAAGLAGGLGPLAVGLAAQAFGLGWALAGLVVVPLVVLGLSATARRA
jgi:MFS transporter, FSR family, fosmidomycin resistance protein